MREPVRQRPVVGEQDQPLAPQVQPAHREEPPWQPHQVPHGREAARAIPLVGEDAPGFVQSYIGVATLRFYRIPIQGDTVMIWIGLLAQLGHPPVDCHSSKTDELFTGTAGAKASAGQYLLYTLFHRLSSQKDGGIITQLSRRGKGRRPDFGRSDVIWICGVLGAAGNRGLRF